MGSKGGGGGGGTTSTTEYVQSPESREMLRYMMPAVQRIGEAGGSGGTLWDVGTPPAVTQAPMPTQGWFDDMDPNIMSGMWEPYQEGSRQLQEQMGGAGMGGSVRGGISGNAAAGLGKFWENAAQGVGQQAWGMQNPNAMAQWQAQNVADQNMWQQQLYAKQAPYQMIPGMAGGAMPTPVQTQQPSGGGGKK